MCYVIQDADVWFRPLLHYFRMHLLPHAFIMLWWDTMISITVLFMKLGCYNYGIRAKASSCSFKNMTREVWVDTRICFDRRLFPFAVWFFYQRNRFIPFYVITFWSVNHNMCFPICWFWQVADATRNWRPYTTRRTLFNDFTIFHVLPPYLTDHSPCNHSFWFKMEDRYQPNYPVE